MGSPQTFAGLDRRHTTAGVEDHAHLLVIMVTGAGSHGYAAKRSPVAPERAHAYPDAETEARSAITVTPDLRGAVSRGSVERAVRFSQRHPHLFVGEANIDLALHHLVLHRRRPSVEGGTVLRDTGIDRRTAGEHQAQGQIGRASW